MLTGCLAARLNHSSSFSQPHAFTLKSYPTIFEQRLLVMWQLVRTLIGADQRERVENEEEDIKQ
jgi:hypothetical protein